MGADRVTVRNLTVVRVDAGNNIMVLNGSVPGAGGGYLVIHKKKA
jgi:large subunit ribosomal protein L3